MHPVCPGPGQPEIQGVSQASGCPLRVMRKEPPGRVHRGMTHSHLLTTRANITQVPREFNGRLARLLELRTAHEAQIARVVLGGGDKSAQKADAQVMATGLKLARCQRAYNAAWAAFMRAAGRQGVAVKAPTSKPRSTEDFLMLMLAEQRKLNGLMSDMVTAVRGLVGTHVSRSINTTNASLGRGHRWGSCCCCSCCRLCCCSRRCLAGRRLGGGQGQRAQRLYQLDGQCGIFGEFGEFGVGIFGELERILSDAFARGTRRSALGAWGIAIGGPWPMTPACNAATTKTIFPAL